MTTKDDVFGRPDKIFDRFQKTHSNRSICGSVQAAEEVEIDRLPPDWFREFEMRGIRPSLSQTRSAAVSQSNTMRNSGRIA